MGCCHSASRVIEVRVPVPQHGSGFWSWGEENCLSALQLLLAWYGNASMAEKRPYQRPYVVHPPEVVALIGSIHASGPVPLQAPEEQPRCVVTDTEAELHNCVLLLHDRLKKVGAQHRPYRYNPTLEYANDTDLRRVHAALYMHLPLLMEAVNARKAAFHATLDLAWINDHVPNRFTLPFRHCKTLVSLFNSINKSRSGGITIAEFARWVDKHSAGDSQHESLFLDFVFLVNGRPSSPGVLDVHEFILVVHTFLTMSHEEMMEHFFSCMADTINEQGHLTVNMRKIQERYPKLKRSKDTQHAGNEMLVTEFQNLAEARSVMIRKHLGTHHQPRKVKYKYKRGNLIRNPMRDKRFSAPTSTGFNPAMGDHLERHTLAQEGQLCTRAQFVELCKESHYIMGPMYMLQSMMHKRVFGESFWSQRAHVIRTENGGKSRPRAKFLTRSISRQMLHTQNSGYLRVTRPSDAALRDAPLRQPLHVGEAKSDGQWASPARQPQPSAPPVDKSGDTPVDPQVDPQVDTAAASGDDRPQTPPADDSGALPGSPVVEAPSTTLPRRASIHEAPAPPSWNGPQAAPELTALTWIRQSGGKMVLVETKVANGDEEVDEEEVLAVLTALDHNHSRLNAFDGVEPLMQLDSMVGSSHFPPLNPGMRQRRHTFSSFTQARLPPPVHATPKRVRHVSSDVSMLRRRKRRATDEPRRRARRVSRTDEGGGKAYDTGDGGNEYVYPSGWSSSRVDATGSAPAAPQPSAPAPVERDAMGYKVHRPYFPPHTDSPTPSAPPGPASKYTIAVPRGDASPSAPPRHDKYVPDGDHDPFRHMYGTAVRDDEENKGSEA